MVTYRKKICLLGSDGVGKTSLIIRYTRNTFSESYLSTLGCDFYEFEYHKNNIELEVFCWDIASQKNFESMRSHYISFSDLVLICVDINRRDPEKYIDPWIEDVFKYTKNKRFILSINKVDLWEDSSEELENLKKMFEEKYNTEVFLSSAKTGENVQHIFKRIGDLLIQIQQEEINQKLSK